MTTSETMPRRSPVTRPGANTGPGAIERTASPETANVAALTRKAVLGEPSRSRTEPTTGPAATAPMPTTARAALAPARSAVGTIRGVVAAAAGGYGAAAAVASPARTGARTTGRPASATTASPSMRTARTRSDTTITVWRSNRSAITPPSGPRTTSGTTRAAVVAASQAALCVRSYTKASSATLYSQSPPGRRRAPPAAGGTGSCGAPSAWCPESRSRPHRRQGRGALQAADHDALADDVDDVVHGDPLRDEPWWVPVALQRRVVLRRGVPDRARTGSRAAAPPQIRRPGTAPPS